MNWKNVAENAVLILIGVVFGSILTFFIIKESNKALGKQLTPIIEQAIAKETTKIENTFETEIKKLKAKNGASVDLKIKPILENKAQTNVGKDSNMLKEKRGFLKRIFGKKD